MGSMIIKKWRRIRRRVYFWVLNRLYVPDKQTVIWSSGGGGKIIIISIHVQLHPRHPLADNVSPVTLAHYMHTRTAQLLNLQRTRRNSIMFPVSMYIHIYIPDWRWSYFYFIGYFKKIGGFNTRKWLGEKKEIYGRVKLNFPKIIFSAKLILLW